MSCNEPRYLDKSIPIEVIKIKSRLATQSLYEEMTYFSESHNAVNSSHIASTPSPNSKSRSRRVRTDSKPDSNAAEQNGHTTLELGQFLIAFLRLWLSLSHPFYTVSDLLKRADITSGSARDTLRNTLLRFKLIIIHEIQKKRSRLQIWEPTDAAYQTLQMPKPRFHSKGGFLHQFIAHHVVEAGKRLGYLAKTEFFLANHKAVDVALFKDDTLIAVEIAISQPLAKELENIVADFSSEAQLTKLVFVNTDAKARKELEALINADACTHVYMDRIQLTLAGCFLNTNPELSDDLF